MIKKGSLVLALLTGCGFATTSVAGDYDYAVGFAYESASADTTAFSTFNGVPDPSLGVSTSSSDSDDIALIGTWYYSGLSDSEGPKARAALLSRASSVAVGYSYGDGSGSFEFSGGGVFPPIIGSSKTSSNSLTLDLRHVWRDSGWYALAGISRTSVDVESVTNGASDSDEFDLNAYALGVGKYLGKATTLDLSVVTLDADNSSPTAVALTFSHVGSLGEQWQYGADVAYAKSDTSGDGDSYAVRGSLYPSADFEFGLGYSYRESGRGLDADTFDVFAGWFVRENVEVSAYYRQDDPDTLPGADHDNSAFGVGAIVRF